jgi:hypothetical protein
MNTEKEIIKNLLELHRKQNDLNHDPYMLGMYNGMELCLSILENREPVFRQISYKTDITSH